MKKATINRILPFTFLVMAAATIKSETKVGNTNVACTSTTICPVMAKKINADINTSTAEHIPPGGNFDNTFLIKI